jgi:hypothetical protein
MKGDYIMLAIRTGFFETNSSSVHVLVIPKDTKIDIPHKVFLSGGEYGWESDTEYDTLNYFYQACLDYGKEEVDKFFNYLKRKGVEEIHAPELNWVKSEWNGREYEYAENNNGYIDHVNEVPLATFFANENNGAYAARRSYTYSFIRRRYRNDRRPDGENRYAQNADKRNH